jgi:hypothetical protein
MFRFPWLASRTRNTGGSKQQNRRLICEPLERRELLAGDLESIVGIISSTAGFPEIDIATDSAGNTYLASTLGKNSGTIDLDPAHGYADNRDLLSSASDHSLAYFAKYLPDGSLDWVRHAQSPVVGSIYPTRIIAAPSGDGIFFSGIFLGSITIGSATYTDTGISDRFVGKLDADGTFAWSHGFSVVDHDELVIDLAVDEDGQRLFVTGTNKVTYGNLSCALIAIDFSDTANVHVDWNTDFPGGISALEVTSSGQVVAVGSLTGSADFDPGSGKYILSSGSGKNAPTTGYIWKLSSTGSLVSAVKFEPAKVGSAWASDVAIDTSNNLYVAGRFSGKVDFRPGSATLNLTSSSGFDGFFAKVDPSGNVLYAKQYAAANDQIVRGIAVGPDGVYLTGVTTANGTSTNGFVVNFADSASGGVQWQYLLTSTIHASPQQIAINPVTGLVNIVGLFRGDVNADADPDSELSQSSDWDDLFWLSLTP